MAYNYTYQARLNAQHAIHISAFFYDAIRVPRSVAHQFQSGD